MIMDLRTCEIYGSSVKPYRRGRLKESFTLVLERNRDRKLRGHLDGDAAADVKIKPGGNKVSGTRAANTYD